VGRDGWSIARGLDHQTKGAYRLSPRGFNSWAPESRGEGVTAMSNDVMNVSRAATRSSRAVMKSLILKRSIMIDGQKTSVSLEDEFWQALKQIAAGLDMKMAELVHQIGQQREYGNLSSALRLFVLEHYLSRAKARRDTEVAQDKVCSPT
jgi:predicted DNA-binding ribbon-helix-helix protein